MAEGKVKREAEDEALAEARVVEETALVWRAHGQDRWNFTDPYPVQQLGPPNPDLYEYKWVRVLGGSEDTEQVARRYQDELADELGIPRIKRTRTKEQR